MTRPPPSTTLFPYTTLFRSEDRPAIDFRRDTEGDAAGKICLDEAGDHVHRGTLRREDEVNADGARLLREHRQRRSEEHTSELQSRLHLVCRLLLENKKSNQR